MNTVIVTGSRDLTNRQKFTKEQLEKFKRYVFEVLDRNHALTPITLLVQGDANGADILAKEWAKDRGVKCNEHPADWKTHGKAAGPIRNIEMLETYPEARVLAFPMGLSKGTRHCIKEAKRRCMNVGVHEI